MAIIRGNYVVFYNHFFNDKNLSLEEIGLLSKIVSQKEDFCVSFDDICSMCKENKKTIEKIMDDLRKHGYIDDLRIEEGKYTYTIHEIPQTGGNANE